MSHVYMLPIALTQIEYQLLKHISHFSGAILKPVSAHGLFVMVWLVMTMTHAHATTPVVVASVLAHALAVTQCVSTVMAAAVA